MSGLFYVIADMSVMASIVILVVLLARLLLKRAPKIFSYVLWAVVLLRLLCPFTLETEVSLIPKEAESISQERAIEDYEHIPVSSALMAGAEAIGDAANGGLGLLTIVYDSEEYGLNGITFAPHDQVWLLIFRYVWLIGIVVMIVCSFVSYIKLRRKLIGAVLLRENIYLADHITSPFVMGLGHPTIYLPSSLSKKEQEYIILHEQHHIWRFDHVVKALAFIALCIHWFNPLVWVAFVLSGKDMEMSCDEAVIKILGADIRADYSASLLSLATGRHIIAGTPLAFGEGDTTGRIKNLAKWKKPALWISIVAMVLIVVVLITCGTNTSNRSWFRGEMHGMGIDVEFNLEEPINSWAIYEDIYEEGELIYSEPRIIHESFEEYGGTSARKTSLQLRFQYSLRAGEKSTWTYTDGRGGGATLVTQLPNKTYTGSGGALGDGVFNNFIRRRDLPESGEVVLFSVALSTLPNGVVTHGASDGIIPYNDTVVQFRLVTSEKMGFDHFEGLNIPVNDLQPHLPVYSDLMTYKPVKCLYMNPLSSFAAPDGDSGYRYTFGVDSVTFTNQSNGNEVVMELGEWQEFPWSNKEWAAMFWPDLWSEEIQNLTNKYEVVRYCPLSEKYFLLYVDGTNWIVEMYNINKVGWRIWSIFEIVPEYS